MKKISFTTSLVIMSALFIGLLALAPLSNAEITRLTAADKEILLTQPSKIILKVDDLPASVLSACAATIGESKFRMLNPGDPFKPTTRGEVSNTEKRRLIWAAKIGESYLINYETSGIVHLFHVGLVKPAEKAGTFSVVWMALANRKLSDYQDFVFAVKSGTLDDRFGQFE